MERYHITKKDDKWRFEKEGSDRAIKKADTKAEVVKGMQDYMDDKIG